MVCSPNGKRSLTCGRMIIIRNRHVSTRYGMILSKKSQYGCKSMDLKHDKTSYTVLVTCDSSEVIWNVPQVNDDSEMIVEPYTENVEIYCPQRPCAHNLVEVREEDILVITDNVKQNLSSEAMINDFYKRKQPRFRWYLVFFSSSL